VIDLIVLHAARKRERESEVWLRRMRATKREEKKDNRTKMCFFFAYVSMYERQMDRWRKRWWRLNIYTFQQKRKLDRCIYILYASLPSTDWLPPAAMTKMKMINIHSNNESVCPRVCMWHVMMMTCNSKAKERDRSRTSQWQQKEKSVY